jgi:succinate dehydrogenase/fumarate reductase flavoprotein subunit
MMETRYLNADLLILGGGSAGCMAAIRALDLNHELKVVIFEKGDIKYSGSIARGMDALNIVTIPNYTTPYLYIEAVSLSCLGVLDGTILRDVSKKVNKSSKQLVVLHFGYLFTSAYCVPNT